MNKQELINYFGVSESTIKTNFPKFAQKQLEKGILITRIGKGEATQYFIEQVEPAEMDKTIFSKRKEPNYTPLEYSDEELKEEIWKLAFCAPSYEVSTLGRVRKKETGKFLTGCTDNHGYIHVSLEGTDYSLHRIILQTFDPQVNFKELTVDHINGCRIDNKISNLRWVTNEENIAFMMQHRSELNKELTRIINLYGYEATLKKLQAIQ